MALFWQQGYGNTSLKNLEQALGLTAPSIYHAFGSKEGLFLQVMDHYLAQVVDQRIAQFLVREGQESQEDRESDPLDNIRCFFISVIEKPAPGQARLGCLLTNSATELGETLPAASKKIQRGLKKIRQALLDQLQCAKAAKQLQCDDIEALADQLAVSYQGILVISRLNVPRRQLLQSVESALAVLT